MNVNVVKKIRSSPKDPGVYIFYSGKKVLYVGKAANLRARLKSYLKITDIKTQSLHEEADHLEYLPLRSEIEALIEESRLIKELKPKYNVLWMDDKSYLYVCLTRQTFPRVFITHQNLKIKNLKLKIDRIGPFTDGAALRLVMKLLRRQFPYCTCMRPHLRDCLNAQIGLCLGVCCQKERLTRQSDILQYKRNIKMIKTILRGQSKKILKTLTNEKEKRALEKIFEHRPYLHEAVRENSQKHVIVRQPTDALALGLARPSDDGLLPARPARRFFQTFPDGFYNKIAKVECYDNSNFAGKEAVGAMTALVKKDGVWQSDKNSYRKFKIKSAPTRDDPRMMYEVVSRRLKHSEWPYPDLIIIDGGLTQYNAAKKALTEAGLLDKIKLVSFAKPHQQIIGWTNAPQEIKKLIEQAIYQTHNFVIRYHRQVRQKEMFGLR